MAKGFDHLLLFLLDEIAITGTQGTTSSYWSVNFFSLVNLSRTGLSINGFKYLVTKYYSSSLDNLLSPEDPDFIFQQDRKLLIKVWKWLTTCSDLLVGPNGELNSKSLSEVEALETAVHDVHGFETNQPAPRLFVTEERMWQSVAGHAKDHKLVPPFHFTLMCIIAAAGSSGLSQPALIAKSGQDKRSVPKRTDYLAEKGYIEKRPIYIKGAKSSLLTHKKAQTAAESNAQNADLSTSAAAVFQGSQLDFPKFMWYLADRLKVENVMTEADLMAELGNALSMKWHREMTRKAIDKLVIAGILECFTATSNWRTANGKPRKIHCIKLLRTPIQEDVKNAFNVSNVEIVAYQKRRGLNRYASEILIDPSLSDSINKNAEFDDEFANDEGNDDITRPHNPDNTTTNIERRPSFSHCSNWDMEGLPYDMIFKLIQHAGQKGAIASDIRDATYGPFYGRVVDVILRGLSDVWEHSQPAQLRHFTVIRDTEVTYKSLQYVYRSFENFQQAVDAKTTDWGAIGGDSVLQRLKSPTLDRWGFVALAKPLFHTENRIATLKECAMAIVEKPVALTALDPKLRRGRNGEVVLQWSRLRTGTVGHIKASKASPVKTVKRAASKTVKPPRKRNVERTPKSHKSPKTGPPMIKGLPQTEYNRIYRLKRKIEEDRKLRLPQLERYATWLATQEMIQESKKNAEIVLQQTLENSGSSEHGNEDVSNTAKTGRKRKNRPSIPTSLVTRKRAKLGEIGETRSVAISSTPEPAVNREVQSPSDFGSNALSDSAVPPVEVEPLTPSETRVSELVELLGKCSTQGLHVNPPGSSLYMPGICAPRGQPTLVVLFKLEQLKNTDWFTAEINIPGHGKATGVQLSHANDTLDLIAGPSSRPSPALDSVPVTPVRMNKSFQIHDQDQVSEQDSDTRLSTKRKTKKPTPRTVGVFRIRKQGRPRINDPSLCLRFVLPLPSTAANETDEDEQEFHTSRSSSIHRERASTPNGIDGASGFSTRNLLSIESSPDVEALEALIRNRSWADNRLDRPHMGIDESEPEPQADHPSTEKDGTPTQDVITPQSTAQQDHNKASSGPSSKPGNRSRRRMADRQGGKLGAGGYLFRRGNKLIGIIEKCNGVFPGDGEILLAFNSMQRKIGQGTADRKTIHKLIKSLVEQDRIYKVPYYFTPSTGPRSGETITKHVLLLPGVSFDIPKVQEIIEETKAAYPRWYIPPEVEYREPFDHKNSKPGVSRYINNDDSVVVVPNMAEGISGTEPWERDFNNLPLPGVRQISSQQARLRIESLVTRGGATGTIWTIPVIPARDDSTAPLQTVNNLTITEPRGSASPRQTWNSGLNEQEEANLFRYTREISPLGESFLEDGDDGAVRQAGGKRTRRPYVRQIRGPEAMPRYYLLKKESHQRRLMKPRQVFHQLTGTFSTEFKVRRGRLRGVSVGPNREVTRIHDLENVPGAHERLIPETPKTLGDPDTPNDILPENPELDKVDDVPIQEEIQERPRMQERVDVMEMDVTREFENFTSEGYNVRLVGDGKTSNFVTYTLNEPHVLAPLQTTRRRVPKNAYPAVDPVPGHLAGGQRPVNLTTPTILRSGPRPEPAALEFSSTRLVTPQHFIVPRSQATPDNQDSAQKQKAKTVIQTSYINKDKSWVKLNPNCVITPRAARKLLYAVIIAQKLAGGVSQNVPWHIVDSVFLAEDYPNYSQQNFRRRWEWMLRNHEDIVRRLQHAFEIAFLEAYEYGEIAPFDINNVQDYDWSALVEWALANIDVIDEQKILPSSRSRFNDYFDLDLEQGEGIRTLESFYRTAQTTLKRHAVFSSIDFTVPLTDDHDTQSEGVRDFELARSWARAALAKVDSTVGDPVANAKLKTLDNRLLKKAIESLIDDRIIMPAPKNTSRQSGPPVHYVLLNRLEAILQSRPIKPQDYAEAKGMKRELDSLFKTSGASWTFPVDAKNGQVLALNEMSAHKRIRIIQHLPPINSELGAPTPRISVWGMTEGSYEAKKVDKDVYVWGLTIVPTESYVFGMPLVDAIQNTEIPLKHPEDPRGRERLPCWVNIHGSLIPARWQECLIAVVGFCSLEAGTTVKTLVDLMKVVVLWEVELVVQWLLKVGVLKGDQGLYGSLIATEWWWTIFSE